MRKKTKQPEKSSEKSIRKVVVFCFVVCLLIALSLLVRVIVLFKDSSFDGENRFTFAVVKQSRPIAALSFDPSNKSAVIVHIINDRERISPQKLLGVPVDGNVSVPDTFLVSDDPSATILKLLTTQGVVTKNLNELDFVRIFLFTKSLALKDITRQEVRLPIEQVEMDVQLAELFADTRIIDENISIEVINGTDIPGLGKRLERLVKNAGGNVVSVTNSNKGEHKSRIQFFGKVSYTHERLQKLLGYPMEEVKTQKVADITIIIGKNTSGKIDF